MKTIVDIEAAHELELYAENTRRIYDRCTMPTIENLKRKAKKGQYNKEKAVKAWEYVAEAAAKEYAREFASPTEWHTIFNAATRWAVAATLEDVYYNEYIMEEAQPNGRKYYQILEA